jgi:DNA invertase Pin-like site-specific DNA recombinase
MATVAQREASAIFTRTRDALAAKKAQGMQLGNPANLIQEAREKS